MAPVTTAAHFLQALATHGDRPAITDGADRLDYAELIAQVQRRRAQLAGFGARRVALCLDNGIDWVLWDLALLAEGLVCVPVPAFFSEAQQRHVVDSAGVDTLIGEPASWSRAEGFHSVAPGLSQRSVLSAPPVPPGTVKITYTSGTTGLPKGVCLDAAALLAVAGSLWDVVGASGARRHLAVLPLATLLENVAGVYAPLLGGACTELRPMAEIGLQGASGLDLPRLLARLGESRPDSLILLPQLLQALVAAAERGWVPPPSLRFIAVGGAHVAPSLLRRAVAVRLPVFEGYGLSECASVVCLNAPDANRIGTVGSPLPHARVRLAGDGEVLVQGARMLGYLGDAPETGEWLATGDLGHFDAAGHLVLHGRKKHQFITAYGRNVNPEWVETELTQQAPIAQAWLYGEALPQNLAVLVPRHAGASDAELAAAVDAVNQGLPDYARAHHWRRADQAFTADNGLATSNGRLRREALRARYAAELAALDPLAPVKDIA
jgi:long-chain acyl-CoA synthetase